MEYIEVTTGPTVLPVSVADMNAHLRLNDTTENALVSDWIEAAAFMFLSATGYALTSTSLRLNLDCFPARTVFIPRHPVTSITSVQYLDTAGSWQTVSGSDYTSDIKSVPARVTFKDTFAAPTLHPTAVPNVRVNFVAGHALAASCPKLALVAVKQLVGHYYRQREAYGEISLTGRLEIGLFGGRPSSVPCWHEYGTDALPE